MIYIMRNFDSQDGDYIKLTGQSKQIGGLQVTWTEDMTPVDALDLAERLTREAKLLVIDAVITAERHGAKQDTVNVSNATPPIH